MASSDAEALAQHRRNQAVLSVYAERDAARAEVERLRSALGELVVWGQTWHDVIGNLTGSVDGFLVLERARNTLSAVGAEASGSPSASLLGENLDATGEFTARTNPAVCTCGPNEACSNCSPVTNQTGDRAHA